MELATLAIPPGEAEERLAEYEAALKSERNAQDEAIAMGYRAAARGLPVISLSRTIAAGGYFEDSSLPRLAVGRATGTECFAQWDTASAVVFSTDDEARNRGALVGVQTVRVPGLARPSYSFSRGHTIMPLVPPRFRPRLRRLRHCHILWEVEEWTMKPPRDPALIRHLRGDLWMVLATWDLSELERAVLAMG